MSCPRFQTGDYNLTQVSGSERDVPKVPVLFAETNRLRTGQLVKNEGTVNQGWDMFVLFVTEELECCIQ